MVGIKNDPVPGEDMGKRFLELIDEQNSIQSNMVSGLMRLVESDWNLPKVKKELELLVERHIKVSVELNDLDKAGGSS